MVKEKEKVGVGSKEESVGLDSRAAKGADCMDSSFLVHWKVERRVELGLMG